MPARAQCEMLLPRKRSFTGWQIERANSARAPEAASAFHTAAAPGGREMEAATLFGGGSDCSGT